jgi:hypothetical protein
MMNESNACSALTGGGDATRWVRKRNSCRRGAALLMYL